MSIDHCKHSIFGASKVAADIMVQEYGKYFNIKTGVFRGGCLTGPNHKGAELHGFLSYLVKCIMHGNDYNIFGYKGKQVRDNIHSLDLVNMFWQFYQNPRKGEVYNVGGGRRNSVSILEAIDKIKKISNKKWDSLSLSEHPRTGDHMWYITDFSKFHSHFPAWQLTYSIDQIIEEIVKYEHDSTI
jgi:CDP-paratose 2-epimerase